MQLERALLEHTLPILEDRLRQEGVRMTQEFVRLVLEREEDPSFFSNPINHLQALGVLSFHELRVGDGKIRLFEEDALKTMIRDAREEYRRSGKLSLPKGLVTETTFITERDVITTRDWTTLAVTSTKDGPPRPKPKAEDFGPLIAPESARRILEMVEHMAPADRDK